MARYVVWIVAVDFVHIADSLLKGFVEVLVGGFVSAQKFARPEYVGKFGGVLAVVFDGVRHHIPAQQTARPGMAHISRPVTHTAVPDASAAAAVHSLIQAMSAFGAPAAAPLADGGIRDAQLFQPFTAPTPF